MTTKINETQLYAIFRSFHWLIWFVCPVVFIWISVNSTKQVLVILFMMDFGKNHTVTLSSGKEWLFYYFIVTCQKEFLEMVPNLKNSFL